MTAISASTQNVIDYIGSFDPWKNWSPAVAPVRHDAKVVSGRPGSRQSHQAQCSCGWVSRSYAADHAAQLMADDHNANA